MKTIDIEHLGRAGIHIVEEIAYKKGIEDALSYVTKFLDDDIIESIRELLLGEEGET